MLAASPLSAKTFGRSAANRLVVETASGPITLNPAIDGPIVVTETPAAPGDDCRITERIQRRTLFLRAEPVKTRSGVEPTCSAGFVVGAYFEDVKARTGSGEVTYGIFAHHADIRTGTGTINLRRTESDLVLRTGSGAIKGETSGKRIDAATGSGDIDLKGLTGLVRAKTGSGSVSLAWTRAPASGVIAVTTGSGDLDASFPAATRLRTSLTSASGRVRTDFEDESASLELSFLSGSGGAAVRKTPQERPLEISR
jgi:hypothetical protein